jgi:hypothetical protein
LFFFSPSFFVVVFFFCFFFVVFFFFFDGRTFASLMDFFQLALFFDLPL